MYLVNTIVKQGLHCSSTATLRRFFGELAKTILIKVLIEKASTIIENRKEHKAQCAKLWRDYKSFDEAPALKTSPTLQQCRGKENCHFSRNLKQKLFSFHIVQILQVIFIKTYCASKLCKAFFESIHM